jgi:hypothetical protein
MSNISTSILVLIVVLLLHLLEEIKTGFRRKLPVREMPTGVFIGIYVFVYAFAAITLYLSYLNLPLAIPLAWIFAVAMMINGLGHIGMMVYRRAYFPGGITAFLLIAASAYLMLNLNQV